MAEAARLTSPDLIIHLGDYTWDIQELSERVPEIEYRAVTGNGDYDPGLKSELLLNFFGVNILATHGHKYGVKNGLQRLTERAAELKADLILFGHTHQSMSLKAGKIWLLNPGQMVKHDKRIPASYGIVTISEEGFSCEIRELATEN